MKNGHQGLLVVAGYVCWLMLGTSLTLSLLGQQQPGPREQLQQYVAELRRNPLDDALREKIIKLAQELKPPPAVPEEARRHYVRADVLRSDATSPQGASAAAEEYQQALLEAPWWPDAYRDLGVALEVATRYEEAKKALNLYLLCHPSEDEARKTQDEIYKIEAKQEEAVARAHQQQQDAAEREKRVLRNLEGRWLEKPFASGDSAVWELSVTDESTFIMKWDGQFVHVSSTPLPPSRGHAPYQEDLIRGRLDGHAISATWSAARDLSDFGCGMLKWTDEVTGSVSEDGGTIEIVSPFPPVRGILNMSRCGFDKPLPNQKPDRATFKRTWQ